MTAPTQRQQEVLDFIAAHTAAKGFAPSIRDIGRHFGWSSPNAVAGHLNALKDRGLITWNEGTARTIRVVKP